MAEQDWLAGQFEQNRQHLQAVAYSMLGTVSEAQDAVQEAWLRLGRSDTGGIGDLRGWLTTVVGGSAWTCFGPARPAARFTPAAGCPNRWWRIPPKTARNTRRCWLTRSAWPCSWCWNCSPPP